MLYGKILYHSRLGHLTVVSDDYYIRKILFGKHELPELQINWKDHPVLLQTEKQLMDYLDGKCISFTVPVQPDGTAFQKMIWNALQQIPYGCVTTYGALAKKIGKPNAARAVGNACNRNPVAIIIPCHRVIGASGSLTGYAVGLHIKTYLLDLENKNQP